MSRAAGFVFVGAALLSIAAYNAYSTHAPAASAAKVMATNLPAAPLPFQTTPADSPKASYFEEKVRPIVARCQPCHFKGGKMYAPLPFDNPQTIRQLGTKLFTRIKKKEEQAIIRTFLAQTDSSSKPSEQK